MEGKGRAEEGLFVPEAKAIETILRIGGQMANLIYNLSQGDDSPLRKYRASVKQWDDAARRFREEQSCHRKPKQSR